VRWLLTASACAIDRGTGWEGAADRYLGYTRWASEEAYREWERGQEFARAHQGGGDDLAPAAADSHHLWSYEVLETAGPTA
jgi:heme-degrading monooxygenase HmoA